MRCPTLNELPPPPKGKTGWPWTEESQRLPDKMPDGQSWPIVCIVTPSYNQGQFLEETIRSVLLQGYPNLEYIIMDGGSTDGSVNIIRKYEGWLIHWVSEPDSGQSDAINKGWKCGQGVILAWINSDDSYCSGAVKTAVQFFASQADLGLVYGDCNCVDSASRKIGVFKNMSFNLERLMTGRNLILQPSTFFKRDILNLVGDLNVNLHFVMDYDLWVRVLTASCNIKKVSIVLSNYRIHDEAKSIANQFQVLGEIKKVLDRLYLSNETPVHISRWKQKAYSNYHRSIGEAYFWSGEMGKARKELWWAIRLQPFQPTTLTSLAYILDTRLRTNFGRSIQRLRWSLLNTPKESLRWDDIMYNSNR